MKEKEGLSYSTIHSTLASIVHFFEINDVSINKRKLNKFKGENIAKFEYRSYTHEEINTILSWVDERAKASVLLMASTGMRVGALPDIKLKHLRRWNISNDNSGSGLAQYVYQITVYANSPNHKYKTFCTPESAKIIDEYLEFRKRHGDNIKRDPATGNWLPGESSLFVRNFNTEQQMLRNLPNSVMFAISVVPKTFTRAIIKALEQSGKRDRLKLVEEQGSTDYEKRSSYAKHKNEIHPCHSLRIFAVSQMQRAKIDKRIREMLVGHKTGLDSVYYKPQEEEILAEFLKAVDFLTINSEHGLKKQLDQYEKKSGDLLLIRTQITKSYEQKIQLIREEMESKFQEIMEKIDLSKV
jgi:integrase